jgi:hypothetical protein
MACHHLGGDRVCSVHMKSWRWASVVGQWGCQQSRCLACSCHSQNRQVITQVIILEHVLAPCH